MSYVDENILGPQVHMWLCVHAHAQHVCVCVCDSPVTPGSAHTRDSVEEGPLIQ